MVNVDPKSNRRGLAGGQASFVCQSPFGAKCFREAALRAIGL